MIQKALITVILLLTLSMPSLAVTDVNRPAVSRLWISTPESTKFVCTVSYIQPYINPDMSWVITAAHCVDGGVIARNKSETTWGVVDWRAMIRDYGRYTPRVTDVVIGTVPDVRDERIHNGKEKLWLANKNPEHSQHVYIHGFPRGVEQVTAGIIVGESFLSDLKFLVQSPYDSSWKLYSETFPGSKLAILVPKDSIAGGSSGSPVLDGEDRLVGILWGLIPNNAQAQGIPEGYDLAVFTPIERILEIFNLLTKGSAV